LTSLTSLFSLYPKGHRPMRKNEVINTTTNLIGID